MPTEASRDLAGKAIDIKGKRYVLVSDRVLAFNQDYPRGSITTEMLSTPDADTVVFKATVKPDTDRTFIGHSQATWGDGYINKTSALENAETSAVGRALAFMGIGVLDSIASVDEINKANGRAEFKRDEYVQKKTGELRVDLAWREKIKSMATAEQFNRAVKLLYGELPEDVRAEAKKLLWAKASAVGIPYDKSRNCFVDPEENMITQHEKFTQQLEASLLQPQESPAPRTPKSNAGLQSGGHQGLELISQRELIEIQQARKKTKISDPDYRNILGKHGATSSTELQKANFQAVLTEILDHSKIGAGAK